MPDTIESEIVQAEEKLREAMLTSDVDALAALLSPDLIFTNHLGMVFGKDDDIGAHKTGIVNIESLALSEQKISAKESFAVVSVRAKIAASFNNTPATDTLQFTRVWAQSPQGTWQVVAAHSSRIA